MKKNGQINSAVFSPRHNQNEFCFCARINENGRHLHRLMVVMGFLATMFVVPDKVCAQVSGMQGTEFWTGFLYHSSALMNPPMRDVFQLCFIPLRDCDVVISHAPTSFRMTDEGVVPIYPDSLLIHLKADSATFVSLPNGPELMSQVSTPVPQGLHISSTDTISLYTFANTIDLDTLNDNESGEMEMTAVWPADKLGCDYYVNVYQNTIWGYNPEILVVAAEDSVDVTISASIDGSIPEVSHTLRLGEVVRFFGPEAAGRRVSAAGGKRIAVLAGVENIYIPSGMLTADRIFASMPPMSYCGKKFLVAVTPNRLNDRVQVLSSADNTTVALDGEIVANLSQGEIYEFEIDTGHVASWIESSEPVSVCVYLTGSRYGCADTLQDTPGSYSGDPSMYPLCPVEQWYTRSNFYSYDFPYHARIILGLPVQTFYPHNFVGIAMRTEHVAGMTMDGVAIDTAFRPLAYNPEYSYARMRVSGGVHRLENALGPFEAHSITLKNCSAIASATGWAASETPLVLNQTLEYCQNEEVVLNLAEITSFDPGYDPVWIFDDGTTMHGGSIALTPITETEYSITVLFQHAPCIHTTDTLHLGVTIHPTYGKDLFDTIQEGENYPWHGTMLTRTGDYPKHFSTVHGCDSLVTLHLEVNPNTPDWVIYVPNVFTPDEESNRLFGAVGKNIGSFSISVFTRTGNLVWHADDIMARWDGTHKGVPCITAMYAYIIYYTILSEPNEKRSLAGQVLLLR